MMGGNIRPRRAWTTFTVTLPAHVENKPMAPPPTAEPASCAASLGTVLVVDDDPTVHDVARRSLSKEGYHVLAAASGEEASHFRQPLRELRHRGRVLRLLREVRALVRIGLMVIKLFEAIAVPDVAAALRADGMVVVKVCGDRGRRAPGARIAQQRRARLSPSNCAAALAGWARPTSPRQPPTPIGS